MIAKYQENSEWLINFMNEIITFAVFVWGLMFNHLRHLQYVHRRSLLHHHFLQLLPLQLRELSWQPLLPRSTFCALPRAQLDQELGSLQQPSKPALLAHALASPGGVSAPLARAACLWSGP